MSVHNAMQALDGLIDHFSQDEDSADLVRDLTTVQDQLLEAGRINWERKFQDAVTGNIRATATIKQKLTDTQLALDQANNRIAELEAHVKILDPEKVKRDRASDWEALERASTIIAQERRKARDLEEERDRGVVRVLEGAIRVLQNDIERMRRLNR